MSYPEYPPFSGVAAYYDTLMRGVPYRGWMVYLKQILKARDKSANRVLDLACGTGIVSELLARTGAEVVGIDISPEMIEQAKRKAVKHGLAIRYEVQDAVELDLPGHEFDLCVCFFDSLNYITDPAKLARAIENVYRHLAPGGLFVFDVNSAYALENGFFDQNNLDAPDRFRYIWRSEYDSSTQLCRISMRFFVRSERGVDDEFRETHIQRAYDEAEVRGMLCGAGFGNIDSYHAYSMQPVEQTSDRIFFVAERPIWQPDA